MKESYIIKVRLNPEMAKKLSVMSKREGLSSEKMIVQMISQRISYFERAKSQIKNPDEADLKEFEIVRQDK